MEGTPRPGPCGWGPPSPRSSPPAPSTWDFAPPDEQAALIEAYGRWLNTLSAPAQLVVSTQRVDLDPAARRVTERSPTRPWTTPGSCAGSVRTGRPVRRQVLAVVHGDGGDPRRAGLCAADTAWALENLGVPARVLDGAAYTAALAAAVDPYAPPFPGGRAAPDQIITTTETSGS